MVANQKMITVRKEPCDKNHVYACINIEALDNAMQDLNKGTVLKLWMYFAKNQNNYTFELSSIAVQNFCGMSDKSYREAIKELIAKRYLVKREGCNIYDFYEMPQPIEVPADGAVIHCHTSTFTY